jgi:hypothetical protein
MCMGTALLSSEYFSSFGVWTEIIVLIFISWYTSFLGWKTVLDWYCPFLKWRFSYNTIWVSIMSISHFLIPVQYGCLTAFLLRYHSGIYIMQEPWYIGRVTLVSMWFRMVLTQIITRVDKRLSPLDIPTKYQYLTGITFWYPGVGSVIPLLMVIIDTMHSPIYWCNTSENPIFFCFA